MNEKNSIHCTVTAGNENNSQYIKRKLLEYNLNYIQPDGPNENIPVSLVLKSEDGEITGGLLANIFSLRARCYIGFLWIDEKLRGLGYGTQLIKAIEERAKLENCKIIMLETFSFQAPEFYKKLGYQLYGKLEDYPDLGVSYNFFQKRLTSR